ncbi:MAG: hypothetical protein GY707_05710 [Desulfobacteraceae bacterium]|nr:hypothetical protein [Desulfobacteraceae bacterium]
MPEGLVVNVIRRNGNMTTNFCYESNSSWEYIEELMSPLDIIAFKVTGTAEGWKYRGRKMNE